MMEEDKKEDEEPQSMMAKAMNYWRIISHSLLYHVIQSPIALHIISIINI